MLPDLHIRYVKVYKGQSRHKLIFIVLTKLLLRIALYCCLLHSLLCIHCTVWPCCLASRKINKNKLKSIFEGELFIRYDGASVNSRRKKIQIFFLHRFFYQNSRKNKFKFIFSNVFPKTAEKKKLNLFSPTFFQKQQKK